ncbi:MAG TPA: hypothetical protein VKV73_25185 [Chloroflexota bacterium]|nr:hypothetical protein [Chloroflexota bacterium]
MSTKTVVEQMTYELAARRRATASRRAAYLALARAIVLSDECRERLVSRGVLGGPHFDWESAEAA